MPLVLGLILAITLSPETAVGDIAIANHSFEQPGTVKQSNWTAVPGWSSDTLALDSGVETGQGATDGTWTGFLHFEDPSVWNLTNHVISAGEQFTLRLDAKDSGHEATALRLTIYYEDAGSRVPVATVNAAVTGTMNELTLQFNADDVPASIGKQIGIELNNESAGWTAFDNVRLTSVGGQTLPGTPYARFASDADVTADGGGVVSRWDDQSGNGRDLDRVAGSPAVAVLQRSGGGTAEVVSFDGTSALWIASGDFGTIGGDRSVVVYCRLKDGMDGFLFDGSTGSGKTRAQVRTGSWQAGVQSGAAGFGSADPVTTSITENTWQTHVFVYDETGGSTQVTHYINGVQVGTHNVAVDTDLGGLILADNGGLGDGLHCDIAELVVYDSLLSQPEAAQAGNYMASRWGDLIDAPITYASATAVQNPGNISIYGIHGITALRINSTGNLPSYSLDSLTFNLNGTTDTGGIEELRLYTTGSTSTFDASQATLIETMLPPFSGTMTFTSDHQVTSNDEHFWVAAKLTGGSSINDVLDAEITGFSITGDDAGSYTPSVTAPAGALTMDSLFYSTVLRKQGDDGSGNFRIPGLCTTNAGTLIAVFDVRWNGNSNSSPDLPANIDVGVMRSTDGGFTWGPMQIIMDYDQNVSGSRGNGVGDPAILVDRSNGRIWCVALWSKGNNGWNGSGPGLLPDDTGQFVINYSDDDGVTWTDPVSITSSIKDPSWNLYFNGPGKGICTRDGTLVFAAQYRDGGGTPRSNFIFSTDNGTTWQNSAPAIPSGNPWTTESQIVELDDGSLLLTMRNHAGNGQRLWCKYSWDTGAGETIADGTWGTPWYDQTDPVVMASLDRYRSTLDGHPFSALLFANPDSSSREKMSIRVSVDEGNSWPYKRKIDDRPAAYSCMTVLPDGHIGIFYETGATSSIAQMEFARFPIEWIVGNADSDGDQIPDFYEDVLGLDKNNAADAAQDTDGDGKSNLEEYRAQTNHNDSGSVLSAQIMDIGAGQQEITWPSVPHVRYRVEQSATMAPGTWTAVPGLDKITATGTSTTRQLPATTSTRVFYRVAVP